MNTILLYQVVEDNCEKTAIELKEYIIRSKDSKFVDNLNKSLKYALEKLDDYCS